MARRKDGKSGISKLFSNITRGVSALKSAITRPLTRTTEKKRQAAEQKQKQPASLKKAVSPIKSALTRAFKKAVEKNKPRIDQNKKEIEHELTTQVADAVEDAVEEAVESVLAEKSLEKSQKAQEEAWIRKRREQDIADREYAKEIEAGELIYKQVNDLISAYPTQGSKFLDKALAKEIAKYGRDAVLQGMANAPELVISAAQDILYYEEGAEAIHTAFIRFFESIMGTKIGDYAQELGDVMDEMSDYDES